MSRKKVLDEVAKITFVLEKSDRELLEGYCKEQDMTVSQVVRRAVREFLENNLEY